MNFLMKWLKRKPKDDWELKKLVRKMIESEGPYCDLNFIDLSNVNYMGGLFENSEFNGDISQWNVSRVKDMHGMFKNSKFNGDISKWDVRNVTRMEEMFEGSEFNGDISKWNTSKVECMHDMFRHSKFHGDLSKWKIPRKCVNMLADTKYSLEEVSVLLDKHYHLYTDPRDGNVYRTCRIGGRTWLAENLKWRPSDEHDAHYYVWYDKIKNRSICFYTFSMAKKACPPGWHIPSVEEWKKMLKSTNCGYDEENEFLDAPAYLDSTDDGGYDDYCFSATRSGLFSGRTHEEEGDLDYWTSSIDNGAPLYFSHRYPDAYTNYKLRKEHAPDILNCAFWHAKDSTEYMIPVRCVKD